MLACAEADEWRDVSPVFDRDLVRGDLPVAEDAPALDRVPQFLREACLSTTAFFAALTSSV